MTELSYPWDGTTVGDAVEAEYSSLEFSDWEQMFLSYDRTTMGVVDTGYGGLTGGLQVNAGSGVVTVQTGLGYVNGRKYKNTAQLTLTPDNTPSSRVDRVILRSDVAAQTVRAVILKGTDGSGTPPALTQNASIWEISLAQVPITPGPTIGTITSEAVAIRTPLGPGYQSAELALDDSAHSLGWNNIGVTFTLGPGFWLFAGEVQFAPGTTAPTDARAARIRNTSINITIAQGSNASPDAMNPVSIPVRSTVIEIAATSVIQLQFFAVSTDDIIYGNTESDQKGKATGLTAIRVI